MAPRVTEVSTIRYAYVRFLKGQERDYIPVENIFNFSPKHLEDFDPSKAYMVMWRESPTGKEGEYKAQILMLGATEEELEEKMDKSRTRVPRVLDTSVESSSDEEDTRASDQKRILMARKDKKKAQRSATTKSLKGILAETVSKKRSMPLFDCPPVASSVSSASPASCSCGATSKYNAAKKRYKEAEMLNSDLKASLAKLKENEATYLQLNRDLQRELLCQLKGTGKGKASLYKSSKAKTGEKTASQSSTPAPSANVESADDPEIELMESTAGGESKYVVSDDKVCIGEDIYLTELQWDMAQGQKSISLFVKNLAVSVWGTKVLKDRSVEGKACPRFKNERDAKPPLSPRKLNAITECLMDHIDRMPNMSRAQKDQLKETEGKKYKHYISEKINDTNKLLRRKQKLAAAKAKATESTTEQTGASEPVDTEEAE